MKNLSFRKIIGYSAIVCLFTTMSLWVQNVNAESFGDSFDGGEFQNPNWEWQNEPPTWNVGETREGFLYIDSEPNRNVWASDASHFLYQDFALTPPLQLGIYAGVADPTGNLEVEYEYFGDNLNVTDVQPDGKVATTWGAVKSRY
jgi:hypothetical protein